MVTWGRSEKAAGRGRLLRARAGTAMTEGASGGLIGGSRTFASLQYEAEVQDDEEEEDEEESLPPLPLVLSSRTETGLEVRKKE